MKLLTSENFGLLQNIAFFFLFFFFKFNSEIYLETKCMMWDQKYILSFKIVSHQFN